MGRFRIKKKEVVIPFRETLAYRMILLTGSIIMFLFALYVMIGALRAGITVSFIGAGVIGVVGAFAIYLLQLGPPSRRQDSQEDPEQDETPVKGKF